MKEGKEGKEEKKAITNKKNSIKCRVIYDLELILLMSECQIISFKIIINK